MHIATILPYYHNTSGFIYNDMIILYMIGCSIYGTCFNRTR